MTSTLPNIDPDGRYSPVEAASLLKTSTSTLWRDARANRLRYSVRRGRNSAYMKFKGIDLISYWKTKQ